MNGDATLWTYTFSFAIDKTSKCQLLTCEQRNIDETKINKSSLPSTLLDDSITLQMFPHDTFPMQ